MKKTVLFGLLVMIAMSVSAQKYGHINVQELYAVMPEIKEIQVKLDTLKSTYENQLANMQEEFNKKVEDFQKNQSTMTDGVKEFRQQEISEMEQRVRLFLQTAQQDLQKKEEEFLKPVHEKVSAAIEKVGQAGGYTYIFEASTLHYISNDATDVMSAVKKELNIK